MATALTKLIVLIKGGGEVIASLPRFIEAPHNDKKQALWRYWTKAKSS